jgi:hypothetical protein
MERDVSVFVFVVTLAGALMWLIEFNPCVAPRDTTFDIPGGGRKRRKRWGVNEKLFFRRSVLVGDGCLSGGEDHCQSLPRGRGTIDLWNPRWLGLRLRLRLRWLRWFCGLDCQGRMGCQVPALPTGTGGQLGNAAARAPPAQADLSPRRPSEWRMDVGSTFFAVDDDDKFAPEGADDDEPFIDSWPAMSAGGPGRM